MSLYNTYSILLHDTVDHVILYGFSGVGVKHEMVRSCLIKVNWDLSESDQKLKNNLSQFTGAPISRQWDSFVPALGQPLSRNFQRNTITFLREVHLLQENQRRDVKLTLPRHCQLMRLS